MDDTPTAPRCPGGRDTPPATPQLLVATRCYEIATSNPANAPVGVLGIADCFCNNGSGAESWCAKHEFETSSLISASYGCNSPENRRKSPVIRAHFSGRIRVFAESPAISILPMHLGGHGGLGNCPRGGRKCAGRVRVYSCIRFDCK